MFMSLFYPLYSEYPENLSISRSRTSPYNCPSTKCTPWQVANNLCCKLHHNFSVSTSSLLLILPNPSSRYPLTFIPLSVKVPVYKYICSCIHFLLKCFSLLCRNTCESLFLPRKSLKDQFHI